MHYSADNDLYEMSSFAKIILDNKYAHTKPSGHKESWFEVAERVGRSVMGGYVESKLVDKVVDLIKKRKMLPGGRMIANSGRPKPQINNCFLACAEDSREGWADVCSKAVSVLTTGGGFGCYYSKLRPKGSLISGMGGESSGATALMNMVNELGRYVMSGGMRRSALWAGLQWNHGDVFDFIRMKDWSEDLRALKHKDYTFPCPMEGTNISICLDDAFFSAYYDDQNPEYKLAHDVYWLAVARMVKTGEPGFSVDIGSESQNQLRNPCCEIVSGDDGDVCNLANLNLARFNDIDEFEEAVYYTILFQLCATQYSVLPMPYMYKIREKNRRLGLGLLGLHEWLMVRGRKYGPDDELSKWLTRYEKATQFAYEWADTLNISRPIANRCLAPCGSVSIVAETTSGIEPLFSTAYRRRWLEGTKWHAKYVIDEAARRVIARGVDPDDIEDSYDLAEDYERRIKFQAYLQASIDNGISSCLIGDSGVLTSSGLFDISELAWHAPVKQFAPVSENCSSYNLNNNHAEITEVYNNGMANTVRVLCENGFKLECTKNHKLAVLNDKYEFIWKEAGSLKPEDVLVGRIGLNLWNKEGSQQLLSSMVGSSFAYVRKSYSKTDLKFPIRMNTKLARLLGYLCSDGHIGKNGIGLTQQETNPEVCDDFCNLVKEIFNLETKITRDKRTKDLLQINANSREVSAFCKWLGLTDHDHLTIPACIRKSTGAAVRAFIKGMTLDGYVRDMGLCVATSVSKKYLEQAQQLLLNLGIDSYLGQSSNEGERLFPSGGIYKTKESWCLITCKEESTRFMQLIGFAEKRKQVKANKIFKRQMMASKTRSGTVPDYSLRSQARLVLLPKLKSDKLHQYVTSTTAKSHDGMGISRECLLQLCDLGFQVPEHLIDRTYIYRSVKSVEETQALQQTYDLSVPDGNSYIANGFVVHNTLNIPSYGSTINNNGTVNRFGETLLKYLPQLRGFTVYPDGSRGGQPLTRISYHEAIKHVNQDKFQEGGDISTVTYEETGNERACVNGVCGT